MNTVVTATASTGSIVSTDDSVDTRGAVSARRRPARRPAARRRLAVTAAALCTVGALAAAPALTATADAAPTAATSSADTASPSVAQLTSAARRLPAHSVAASAAESILAAGGATPATPSGATPAAGPTDVLSGLAAVNAILKTLKVQPFLNPSVSFNCAVPTADNPLGIVPGVSGAVAGPWTLGTSLPTVGGFDPNIVKSGDTAFAFVPSGITSDTVGSGMQVAWFNVNTLQGGFAQMGKLSSVVLQTWLAALPTDLPPILRVPAVAALTRIAQSLDTMPGMRLAPVKTGHGTVLAAVYGTVDNGGRSCFFFPMVGIVNA